MTITPRQAEIYAWIRHRIQSGTTPTYREIGKHFGISSPNGVICHIRLLEKKGLLRIVKGTTRCIRLVDRERIEVLRERVIEAATAFVNQYGDHVKLPNPLVDAVAAYRAANGKDES